MSDVSSTRTKRLPTAGGVASCAVARIGVIHASTRPAAPRSTVRRPQPDAWVGSSREAAIAVILIAARARLAMTRDDKAPELPYGRPKASSTLPGRPRQRP